MSINRVNISGNLTRDSDLRQTNGNGTPVLNFSVAVNDRRKNQQTDEWEDYANFVDCSLFGRRAEALAQYLKKGTKVAIDGKLRYSTWQDKNTGETRHSLGVLVDEIEFMSRGAEGGQGGGGGNYSEPAPQQSDGYDDDMPF